MMRSALTIVTWVTTLATAAPLLAQPLDLQSARERARSVATDARVSEVRLREAALESRRAWARLTPRIEATAGWTLNDREVTVPLPDIPGVTIDQPTLQHRSLWGTSVQLQTQLLDPAFFAHRAAARHLESSARARLEAVRDGVELATIEMYLQLRAFDSFIEVAEADVVLRGRNLDAVEARRAVLTATDFDVHRAETEVAQAELTLEELALDRRQLARALAELLDVEVIGELTEDPPAPDAVPDVSDEPWRERADVLAASRAVAAAEERVRTGRLDYWPDLVAAGEHRWSSEDAVDGERTSWMITFGLSWLILDRGLLRLRTRQAEVQRDEAFVALDDVEDRARRELTDSRDILDTARRRLVLAERRVGLAEEALVQAEVGYTAEVLTNLELLEAQTAVLQARTGRVRAELDLELARWRVRWAMGAL